MILYWGVRSERDLYAHTELEDFSRRAANFRYVPVLSEPGAAWSGRRGWVHEAVLNDFATLDPFDVYASGPPAMITALRRDFDSFDYAPDTLERQRTTAATKS